MSEKNALSRRQSRQSGFDEADYAFKENRANIPFRGIWASSRVLP